MLLLQQLCDALGHTGINSKDAKELWPLVEGSGNPKEGFKLEKVCHMTPPHPPTLHHLNPSQATNTRRGTNLQCQSGLSPPRCSPQR